MNPAASINRFYDIRESWKYCFRGIRMNRVLIFEMYNLARDYDIGAHNHWLRLACHSYDLSQLNISKSNYILSTFGQQNRRDHKEVYDYVLEQLRDAASCNDLNKLPLVRRVRPVLIARVVCGSMWALRHCKSLSLKQKLRLSLVTCVYCNSLLDLERLPLHGIKKYLSMYHVDQLENLITQYMKLKGIPTYSLCEGVYLVDKEFMTIDSVNYTNFETDHLLVWGQYVIDQFVQEGIPVEKMMIGGYPHPVELMPMRLENKMSSCFVLLARPDFIDADMRLLQILSRLSGRFKFYIKPHPNCNWEMIETYALSNNMEMIPKSVTVNECMCSNKYDWAIAVNTTAYYEALMRGIPCLRYDDGSYKLFPGGNDDFRTKEQLLERVQYIASNLENGEYQKDVDNLLEYVMGVGINNYKVLLDK